MPERQWLLDIGRACCHFENDLRFEQMLDKLLDNAKDYTPSGGRITIGIRDHIDTVGLWVKTSLLKIQDGVDAFQMFSGTRNDSTGSHLFGTLCRALDRRIDEGSGLNSNDKGVRTEVTGLRVP